MQYMIQVALIFSAFCKNENGSAIDCHSKVVILKPSIHRSTVLSAKVCSTGSQNGQKTGMFFFGHIETMKQLGFA